MACSRGAARAGAKLIGALVAMLFVTPVGGCAGQPGPAPDPPQAAARQPARSHTFEADIPVPAFKPAPAGTADPIPDAAVTGTKPARLASPAPQVTREILQVRLDATDGAADGIADAIAAAWPAPAAGPPEVAPGLIWPSPARPSPPTVASAGAGAAAGATFAAAAAAPEGAAGAGAPGDGARAPPAERGDPERAPVAEVAAGASISVSRGTEPGSEPTTQLVWVTDRSHDLRAASLAGGEALRARQPAEALAIYQEILRLLPAERSALLGAAAALRQLDRVGEAERIYRLLLDKNPRDRFAEISLWGARSEREPQEALSQLRRMAWQDPDDGRVRAQIGLILARRGQLDRAIAELQAALRLDPANARYRADLVALGETRRRGPLAGTRPEAIDALGPKVE